jgi:hypothetical protein
MRAFPVLYPHPKYAIYLRFCGYSARWSPRSHIIELYMLMRFLSMYFLVYSITDDLKEIIDIDEHPD